MRARTALSGVRRCTEYRELPVGERSRRVALQRKGLCAARRPHGAGGERGNAVWGDFELELGETLEFPVDATEASGGDEDFNYIDYLMEDSP